MLKQFGSEHGIGVKSSSANSPSVWAATSRATSPRVRRRTTRGFSYRPEYIAGWTITLRTLRGRAAGEPHERPEFVVVDPRRQSHDRHRVDAEFLAMVGRPELRFEEFPAATQQFERASLEAVELEIDGDPPAPGRELFGEAPVGQPYAVSVDVHLANAEAEGVVEDGEELRVDRRLAPGKLNQVGVPFALRQQAVEEFGERREREELLSFAATTRRSTSGRKDCTAG